MKSITAIILGSMMLFLLTSCATNVPMASLEQDMMAKKFHAPSDNALMYVIRPSIHTGWMMNIPVMVDRLALGNLKNGSYALMPVAPGEHVISWMGNFEGDSFLKLKTEPGKLYFIKMYLSMGWAAAKINMETMSEDEGKKLVDEYELIETN